MRFITKLQQKILLDLFRNDGEIQSLSKMADRIDATYPKVWSGVNDLEKMGIIETNRANRSMIIRLCASAENPLSELLWGKRGVNVQTTNDKRVSNE